MTDPVQTTQQTSDAVTATGVLGVIGVFLGAVAGFWRTVFGTKAERQDATERAAEIALRAAEADAAARLVDVATDVAEEAREDTRRVRVERDDCTTRLAAMDVRLSALEREHSGCGPRIAALEADQRLSRTMLADLMRNASTPPSGLYVPEDVRAALAAQEDTGP